MVLECCLQTRGHNSQPDPESSVFPLRCVLKVQDPGRSKRGVGTNPGCSSWECKQLGEFCGVKLVDGSPLTWLPVWTSRLCSPLWLICPPPGEPAQQCFSSVLLRWDVGALSSSVRTIIQHSKAILFLQIFLSFLKPSFCPLASSVWADTHSNPLILVCCSTRLWESYTIQKKGGEGEQLREREGALEGEEGDLRAVMKPPRWIGSTVNIHDL